jgi:hypothetical protein
LLSFFQDFAFSDYWKSVAVILTGVFAYIALVFDNKDKLSGQLTHWGKLAIGGIIVSSIGGLLAQIQDTVKQSRIEKERHDQILSILNDQERLLRPLKLQKLYAEFKVPCDGPYASFCASIRAFRRATPQLIYPSSIFDSFPGGRGAVLNMSVRFFVSEQAAKQQLITYSDEASLYSVYLQLPLLAGNDMRCGVRAAVIPPNEEVHLAILESCPFTGVNNFGNLQSYLDLSGSVVVQAGVPIQGIPPLEPIQATMIYEDAKRDIIANLKPFSVNNYTMYFSNFTTSRVSYAVEKK